MFEYFIYKKLELEEEKLGEDKRALTKRVLEKLALTMEIYQTNVITQDELMTFFDDVRSDLKLAVLSHINPFEVFYEYSLLKVSHEALHKIEFDNTEFQEYLAAKEVTRFAEPTRTAFAFAVDSDAGEIHPSWYNTLTFLVDMEPNLLEQLVEFSGLRADTFKVMDESFLTFLGRVSPGSLNVALRAGLFKDIVEYHERTRQWVAGQLAQNLPNFYQASLEPYLKTKVVTAEGQTESGRYVPLGNIAYIVAYLLRSGATLDRSYWHDQLISWASDPNDNGVLQRHALLALQYLGDSSVIDELPDFTGSEELIKQEFLSLCTELAPDHPKSLQYFIRAVKAGESHGRYGLLALKERESLKFLLKTLASDVDFTQEFFEGSSIFSEQDGALIEHLQSVLDDEMRNMSKELLVKATSVQLAYYAQKSTFIAGLWKALRRADSSFVSDMVNRVKQSPDGKAGFYFSQELFSQVLEREDVQPYVSAMIASDERNTAHSVMVRVKLSAREGAEEIYETGRSLLQDEYRKWEEEQNRPDETTTVDLRGQLLAEFRKRLEPAPGKYSPDVFAFYNKNSDELESILTPADRERLKTLLSGSVFKVVNPAEFGVTITDQRSGATSYTTSSAVQLFSAAVDTASRLGIDITPYRQQILNLIPFAYSETLKTIFNLVPDVRSEEMVGVVNVYRNRYTDLWRHQPSSFVEAIKQYHLTEAIPVVKVLIMDPAWEVHVRCEALSVVESISPDAGFLNKVFDVYRDHQTQERDIAHVANSLLITNHADRNAILWRLRQVIERAAPFARPRSGTVHSVGELEEELSHSNRFAKPLMELRYRGYENDYLDLLAEGMNIWSRGKEFHEYAGYMWKIVYAHFDNLKDGQSYDPVRKLENKIISMRDREGANWLASRTASLRHSYLAYLGKPANISKAITKYNDARSLEVVRIQNANDLFHHVQDALDVDLRRWIEGEGAYDVLGYKIARHGREQYEKLVQKTLKAQIENILYKRGFQVEVLREPQLLDEKRTDLLVRYGFAGPLIIEVKLTSHRDLRGSRMKLSSSYTSMERYMQGYGASHGIFMVIANSDARNLVSIKEAFQSIKGVSVISFDCKPSSPNKRRSRPMKSRKRRTRGSSKRSQRVRR